MAVRTVVLVPGLLASYINRPAILPPFVRAIWPSPTAILTGFWDWMALPLPDQPGLPPFYAQALPGTYLGPAYGPLATYLLANGYPVVSPLGDWRRPLAFDGEALLAQVRALGAVAPVGLVCHSRGGLLARYVCARLVALGEIAKVEAVVTLGTPHTGSMNAVLFLSGQGSLPQRLDAMRFGVSGLGIGIAPLRNTSRILRSWPSVYELLPDPDRSWLPADERAAIYREGTWSATPLPLYGPHLTAAAATWRALPPFPESVRVLLVGGELVETAYTFPALPSDGNLPYPVWDQAGDGTVPLVSAFWPGGEGIQVPCAHDLLPLDARVWPYIVSHLAGAPAPNLTLGGNVLELPASSHL